MDTNTLIEMAQSLTDENSHLKESLAQKLLAIDNVGWQKLGDLADDDGPTLEGLKPVIETLSDMAATNPLHVRGAQLRHSYVFGQGMEYEDVKPAAKEIMADPHNRAVMFSVEAYEIHNLAAFTDGTFITTYNSTTKRFTNVPLRQVTGMYVDPDDSSSVWAIRREWTANGEAKKQWYPIARHKTLVGRSITTEQGDAEQVSVTTVAFMKTTRRQSGWALGVPDSLAAMIFSVTYSEYLRDNALLVRALQTIAWSVTTATRKGSNNAAAQVVKPGVGGTSVVGEGNSISGVGVPSAQVNMNNGQPLAAMVATSFGVPVIALLSSPGATGGSYGAATTLDGPTLKGMKAIQDSWARFYEEILHYLGSKNATITFPPIESDPGYRQTASIINAFQAGAIHQDEMREAIVDIANVKKLHKGVPDLPESAKGGQIYGSEPGGLEQGDTDHTKDVDPD